MNNISSFLEKFRQFLNSNADNKDSIAFSILNVLKVAIDPKKIDIKDGVVYVSANSTVKSELFLKKNKILSEILKNTGKQFKDIR